MGFNEWDAEQKKKEKKKENIDYSNIRDSSSDRGAGLTPQAAPSRSTPTTQGVWTGSSQGTVRDSSVDRGAGWQPSANKYAPSWTDDTREALWQNAKRDIDRARILESGYSSAGDISRARQQQRNIYESKELYGGNTPVVGNFFRHGLTAIGQKAIGAPDAIYQTIKATGQQAVEDEKNPEVRALNDLAQRTAMLEAGYASTGDILRAQEQQNILADTAKELNEKRSSVTADPNSFGMQMMARASENTQKAVEPLIGSQKNIAEGTLSTIENAPYMLAGGLVGKVNPALGAQIALIPMSTIAAAGEMADLSQRGKRADEALMRGLAAGAIEYATEQIGVDNFVDMVANNATGVADSTFGQFAKKFYERLGIQNVGNIDLAILKQTLSEGGEEGLSYLGDYLVDKMYHDPEAKFSLSEMGQQMAGGALGGLLFGTFGSIAQNVRGGDMSVDQINTNNLMRAAVRESQTNGLSDETARRILQDHDAMVRLGQQTGFNVDAVNEMPEADQIATVKSAIDSEATVDKAVQEARADGVTDETANAILSNTRATDRVLSGTNIRLTDEMSDEEKVQAVKDSVNTAVILSDAANNNSGKLSKQNQSRLEDIVARREANTEQAIQDELKNPAMQARQIDQLREAVAPLGRQGQLTAKENYDPSTQPASRYFGEFSIYYNAGLSGQEMSSVKPSRYSGTLTEAQKKMAYEAGVIDAQNSLVSEQTKMYAQYYKDAGLIGEVSTQADEALDTVGKALGIQIMKSDQLAGGRANGSYKNGVLMVASDADNPLAVVVAHEVTHRLQETAPTEYRAYRNLAIQAYAKKNGINVSDAVSHYQNWYELGVGQRLENEEAMDEIAADFTENMVKDGRIFSDLVQQDVKTARTVWEKLHDFLQEIKRKITGRAGQNRAALRKYGVDLDTLEKADRLWKETLDAATKNVAAAKASGAIAEVGKPSADVRNSIKSLSNAMGIQATRDASGKISFTFDGKAINHFTVEHVRNSGLGVLIKAAQTNGFITAEEVDEQYQAAADLMNTILETQDPEMTWAFAGATMFSALKSNADGQYGTTVDFTTVCRKTQDMITAMSKAMVDLGRGLTKKEVTQLQSDLHLAGMAVPCPVCYVFSRWAGIGGTLDTIKSLQDKYAKYTDAELRARLTVLGNEIKQAQLVQGTGKLNKVVPTLLQAKEEEYFRLDGELEKLQKGEQTEEVKKRIKEIKSQMKDLDTDRNILGEYTFVRDIRMNPDYKPVPDRVLFNLDAGAEFSKDYPVVWKYRTSRGPAAGKAILPYADMRLGDLILGVDRNSSTGDTTFSNVEHELNKKQAQALANAIKRTRAQNLIGGQRFQSTSDFRYDYALDYLQAFWELQAMGSTMQTYTKIVEFADMVAAVGGDVNLSVMPRGKGYDNNGNLLFSSVTGMDIDAALRARSLHDSAQTILVGINDRHIRLALDSDIIDFVIPYHTSGASIEDFISELVRNLGEDFTRSNYQDYSDVQTDHVDKERSVAERRLTAKLRDIRKQILTNKKDGKTWTPSSEDIDLIQGESVDITGRSFEDLLAVEKRALAGDEDAIEEYKSWTAGALYDMYNRMRVEGGSDYGIELNGNQAASIMPHEYWNKSTTRDTAYINGFLFRSYCYNLGLHPRFTGYTATGETNHGNFIESTGYWKTLIDRAMYNNDGTYRDQNRIDVTDFDQGMLYPTYAEQNWAGYKVQEPDAAIATRIGKEFAEKKSSDDTGMRYSLKKDSAGNNLTQAQEEYFKDSKVLDEDGNLLVVYHGTDANFTVFDRTKGRSTMDIQGMFFSPWDIDAGGYGANVGEYYLNIKNPAPESVAYKALNRFNGQNNAGIKAREYLESLGYDGVNNGNEEYIAFYPEQIKRTNNLNPTTSLDIRYSVKRDYSNVTPATRRESTKLDATDDRNVARYQNEITSVLDGTMPSNQLVLLGRPSSLLAQYMKSNNLLYMPQSAVKKAALPSTEKGGKHGLGRVVLDELLYQFDDPMAITKNTSEHQRHGDNSIVVWTNWQTETGDSIIVPIRINVSGTVGVYNNVNTEFDLWDQNYAADLMREENILYTKNEKSIDELLTQRREVPKWKPENASSDLYNTTDTPTSQGKLSLKGTQEYVREQVEKQKLLDEMYYGRKMQEQKRDQQGKKKRAVERERASRERQVNRIKEQHAESALMRRIRRTESQERSRLLKIAKRLQNKKLPAVNQAWLNEQIGDLDLIAKNITGKTIENLSNLRDWYEDQKMNNPDFIADPTIEAKISRLLKTKRAGEMSIEEVRDLTDILLNFENEINTQKRMIDSQIAIDNYQLGTQIIDRMSQIKGSKATGLGHLVDRFIVTETLSPIREMRRLAGYDENNPLVILTNELADGQRRMMDYQRRAFEMFRPFTEDTKFMNTLMGKKAKTIKLTGMQNGQAVTVEIPRGMLLSLYLHGQNDQNIRHIAEGGITVPDMDLYKKEKFSEAFARGKTVKFTPSQVRGLASQLTDQERAYAKTIMNYFNGMSSTEINEVSELLKGYSIATLENYFPIQTDSNFRKGEMDTVKFDGTIDGMGFLKERINAANPIMLLDVTDTLLKSIGNHSKYVGLAIPIRNFNKAWGVTQNSYDEQGNRNAYESSVQHAIQNTWGTSATEYVEKMMSDLQSGKATQDAWAKALAKVRSHYAGAVLTLNLSVAMKQAASYPTAGAIVGFKPLAKAMTNWKSADMDLISKYTPLLWYRAQGYSTQELGDMKNLNRQIPKWANWIQGVDVATTKKLWKAAEYYVRDNNKNLNVGTDEYYRAVADVYNRIIEETQPNYTTMQRPQLLRSDNSLMQNLMMFKTQPFQNTNILIDAFGNLNAKQNAYKANQTAENKAALKQAKTNVANAVTSQVMQLAVFAGMTFLWNVFRKKKDKYEDKETGEMTLESAGTRILRDMFGSAVSGIPFGADLWEYASSKLFNERYYGFDVVTASAIDDILTAFTNAGNAIGDIVDTAKDPDKEVNWNEFRLNMDSVAKAVSKGMGIPYENVVNLFNAVYGQTTEAVSGEYLGKYATLKLTTSKEKYAKDYYSNLYQAYKNDRAAYKELYQAMVSDGFDPDTMDKKIAELKNKDPNPTAAALTEEEQKAYDSTMKSVERNSMWRDASLEQQEKVSGLAYELAAETNSSLMDKVEGLEELGGTEADYLLFELALSMVDQPTKGGKLGTYTADEAEEAVRMMTWMDDNQKDYLWTAQGKNENKIPKW